MPGKPAIFPANEQATFHWTSQVEDHVPPETFDLTTSAERPDVSDPPASLFDPHADVDLPDGALSGLEHASLPAHVVDLLL